MAFVVYCNQYVAYSCLHLRLERCKGSLPLHMWLALHVRVEQQSDQHACLCTFALGLRSFLLDAAGMQHAKAVLQVFTSTSCMQSICMHGIAEPSISRATAQSSMQHAKLTRY